MAGSVGSLTVSLGLDAAQFVAGLSKAQLDSQKATEAIKSHVDDLGGSIKKVAGLLGVGLTLSFFKGLIDDAVEARSALVRLSTKLGESVENLAALGKIGKLTGTGLDEISSGSIKLNKALAAGDEGSKQAKTALDALGISYEQIKRSSPADQLQIIAKALAQFQDGTGKATAATLLLGKAGAELLPFLKDLGEQQQLTSKLTTEAAQEAEQYARNLVLIQSAGEEWKKAFATLIIPSLVEFTNQLLDGKKAFGGYFSALTSIGTLTSPFQSVNENLQDTRNTVDKLTATVADLQAKKLQGGLTAFLGPGPGDVVLKKAISDLEKYTKLKNYLVLQQQREALADSGKGALDRFDSKPILDIRTPKAPTAATAAVVDPFERYLKQASELKAVSEEQLRAAQTSEVFTEAQKQAVKVIDQLNNGTLTATAAQQKRLFTDLLAADATERQTRAFTRLVAAAEAANSANLKYFSQQVKELEQVQSEQRYAEEQVRTYGLTQSALDDLAIAKKRDAAATLEQLAAQENANFNGGLAKVYTDAAAAINATADAIENLKRKQQDGGEAARAFFAQYYADANNASKTVTALAQSLTSTTEDFLANLLSGHKVSFKSFVDQIISEVIRLSVVKPILASIFGNGGSAGGSLGGIFELFTKGFGGGVYEQGTNFVPNTGPAYLHKGEAVIPAKFNNAESLGRIYGSGGNTQHIYVSMQAQPNMSRDTVLQQGRDYGEGIQHALARNA